MIIKRKWGHYRVLLRTRWFCIKLLCFDVYGEISYQKHLYRNEWWLILRGSGLTDFGKELGLFNSWFIPVGHWHQFTGLARGCVALELQWGKKVKEEDIVRKNV